MTESSFIKAALKEKEFPRLLTSSGRERMEVALIGRSNVGKSSLINHLTGCRGLARTSKRPGKTIALQFYTYGNTFALVDFPGYGYAETPKAIRHLWTEAVQNYFQTRKTLQLLLLMIDIRRDPQAEEKEILKWAKEASLATIIVLTKSDQIKAHAITQRKKEITELLSIAPIEIISYSIKDNKGRLALQKAIQKLLDDTPR